MILVTGPTGSGKTVSLYTGLNILNREDTNISTAEDPSEINLPGVNQVNVNAKVGLTFAAAMRAFLRQDPDVIMVGEIRDLETAEIAIKAAQTGHLVLSTLHTNDAPQTLTRLVDMGVKPYAIATSVSLIIAQRLARRLLQQLQAADGHSEGSAAEGRLHGSRHRRRHEDFCPEGMPVRAPTATRAACGIYQVLPITDAIARIILGGRQRRRNRRRSSQGRGVGSATGRPREGQGRYDQSRRGQQRHDRVTPRASTNAWLPAATASVKTIKRDVPFQWEGMDKKGNRVKGKSLAPDEAALRADLRRQGIAADRDQEAVRRRSRPAARSNAADIAVFSRQLATMLAAGHSAGAGVRDRGQRPRKALDAEADSRHQGRRRRRHLAARSAGQASAATSTICS